jgi:hypothetical protein
MHENNFEKQVREKMDQLGFDPTDVVWTNVDLEINKEKRKRRPLFWIFFVSGLIVGAAGVYTVLQINVQSGSKMTNQEKTILSNHENVIKKNPKRESHAVETNPTRSNTASSAFSGSFGKKRDYESVNNRTNLTRNADSQVEGVTSAGNNIENDTREPEIIENKDHNISNSSSADKTIAGDMAIVSDAKAQKADKTMITDSVSEIKSQVSPKEKLKTSPWSFAITATAGFSSNNQSLFQSINTANNSYYAYTPSNSSTGAPTPAPYLPSSLEAGFSFGAGVMINRKLSKRVSISSGLNYHYYSTKIHTGSDLDSSRFVYAANGQPTLVNSFYQGGQAQSYTNQYHFIGLPLILSFQMNKSIKNPINWEAGFSFSWLLSTNALHFDPNANVYFKNSQLFNKTQWNAITAVMVGFPVHTHTVELGPQMQYGLSGLLNTNTVNQGHLFYLGIKMSFIP